MLINAEFTRRLETLEKRLLLAQNCDRPARNTESSVSLLGRLEAGRRRVAEARERRRLPPSVEVEPCDAQTERQTIVEILHAGRHRSAVAYQELVEARR